MRANERRYPTAADFDRLFHEERPITKLFKVVKRLAGRGPSTMTAGVHFAACWHNLVSKGG